MKHSETQLDYSGIFRLTEEQMDNPSEVISDFFSGDDIAHYRKYITDMLKNASHNSVWKERDPGELFFFYEIIERLLEAAYLIYQLEKKKKGVHTSILNDIETTRQNPVDTSLYYTGFTAESAWGSFPRYLSEKEFLNPYRVFRKFFKYQPLKAWKEVLHDVFEYALISDSTFTAYIEIDYLTLDSYLKKLVEAAHLIFVRELKDNRLSKL